MKRRVSRISESAAFLMVLVGLRKVPTWAWGWSYKSEKEVYRSKDRSSVAERGNIWDGTTLEQGGYHGELRCINCNRLHPLGEYRTDVTYASGLRPVCRQCMKKYKQAWYDRKIDHKPRRVPSIPYR